MSKYDNSDSPAMNINTFNVEDVVTGSQKGTSIIRDPSVSSWSLPVMEKQSMDPVEKDYLREKLAYERGFKQGHKDSMAIEKQKIEELGKQLNTLFEGLDNLKPRIYFESEEELLKLSLLIAKKIIGEEVRTNNAVIGNIIRSAMDLVVDKRQMKIIINPDDIEEVKRILPDLSKLTKGGRFQVIEDKSKERGGCILETGFGKINATIEDQLETLEEELDKLFNSGRE